MPFKDVSLIRIRQQNKNECRQWVNTNSNVKTLPIAGRLAKVQWTLGLNISEVTNLLSQLAVTIFDVKFQNTLLLS